MRQFLVEKGSEIFFEWDVAPPIGRWKLMGQQSDVEKTSTHPGSRLLLLSVRWRKGTLSWIWHRRHSLLASPFKTSDAHTAIQDVTLTLWWFTFPAWYFEYQCPHKIINIFIALPPASLPSCTIITSLSYSMAGLFMACKPWTGPLKLLSVCICHVFVCDILSTQHNELLG